MSAHEKIESKTTKPLTDMDVAQPQNTYFEKIQFLRSRGWARKRMNGINGVWYPSAPYRHVIPVKRAIEIEQWNDRYVKN